MNVKLETPISGNETETLRIKDIVYLSGTIYTARDRAHLKILNEGPPVDLEGAGIFHAGPIIKIDQNPEIIAIGPTTSTRMNPYEPTLIRMGVAVIIGKGGMDQETSDALVEKGAVYLAAVGGCAALYVKSVLKVIDVHWLDLGIPEAIWELEVQDFGPLIVAMDSHGNNLYEQVKKQVFP